MEKIVFANLLSNYNSKDIALINKAYDYAAFCHNGQHRQSGEDYITHPFNVALILMEVHADADTICAGLLHDVLEDTFATEEEILKLFNPTILKLVKGVTNLVTPELSKKEAQIANIRRVIASITDDIRIIIIKLADRLHNMRTLEYKNLDKQQEKSIETLEIYAPLAGCIGAYNIKSELEDLSLRFLKPDDFNQIGEKCCELEEKNSESIKEMMNQIKEMLDKYRISYEIHSKMRTLYGIYRSLKQGKSYEQMHDLFVIETLVKNYRECYETLGVVHQLYPWLEGAFKDYISTPKTNMYQALHTTVFGLNNTLVQNQIRTYEMDKIAQDGLMYYWQKNNKNAHLKMQSDLNKKFQFYRALSEINNLFEDDKEFVAQVHFELLDKKVYVYTDNGFQIELPYGATVVDAAYHVSDELASHMVKAIVNDEEVAFNYMMQNKDRLHIVTNPNICNIKEFEKNAHTTYARQRIKEAKN